MLTIGTQARSGAEAFWRDFRASIVVLLVAIPLCMGIAMAVGAPMSAGLVSGVIGGIVVGTLGGSPLQVSGPAAGLIVIVAEVLRTHGNVDGQFVLQRGMLALGIAVVIAGLLQIAAGALRLGQWFRAVSPAVIEGMLAGIGVLIIATQFHLMVDDPRQRADGLEYLLTIPEAVAKGLVPHDDPQHQRAASIGVITILVILAWNQLRWRSLRFLPAPLVAVVVAAAVCNGLGWSIDYIRFEGGFLQGLGLLNPRDAWSLLDVNLLLTGLAIAFIASAETLLCATAIDGMHRGPRTRYDRELSAQGIGNLLCGLVGGLPITGVIVRSAANVQAGAATRASTVMHGIWLLALASAFPQLLELIPKSALAAVLVYTGFKLINPRVVRELWHYGKAEVAVYGVTVAVIVVEDLLSGVIVGIVLSAARVLYLVTRLKIDVREHPHDGTVEITLRGNATFLRLPRLAAELEKINPSSKVVIHLDQLTYVDHAIFHLFESWASQHESLGGVVEIDWGHFLSRVHHTDLPIGVESKERLQTPDRPPAQELSEHSSS